MSEENKYLERAIEKYSTCSDEEKSLLEGIFPELRETVDEKIKEAIRYAIGQSKHADGILINGVSEEIALAYLDRNKEEKKEDSGFKVGDWVVNNHGSRSVCLVIERGWPNSRIQDERNECYINSETLNKQYHLWTIQDAEVGDILANKFGCVFIYNGYENDDKVTVDNICHVNIPGEFQIEDHKTGSWFYVSDLMPATRQQRALLFQNIKAAGYEWDEKALILKKIEKTEVKWSEKDDKTIHLACEFIRHHSGKNDSIDGIDCSELINRLKSLQPQPKQEWSEEDKKMLEKCVGYMTKITPIPDKERFVRFEMIKDEECINWLNNRLKSLRPQPRKVDACGFPLRDEGESACSYLERCLAPDMRHVWYEACDEMKGKNSS